MGTDQQARLLRWLRDHPSWVGAQDLAAALGVSTRSLRSYVTELNRRAGPGVVERSHQGYRLRPGVDVRDLVERGAGASRDTPAQRLHLLLRRLLGQSESEHVEDLAADLFVSRTTIESDLARARPLLGEFGLQLERSREAVVVSGPEKGRRRLIRRTLYEASPGTSMLELSAIQAAYPDYDARAVRDALLGSVERHHLDLTDYATQALVLHLIIACDRLTADRVVEAGPGSGPVDPRVAGVVADVAAHLREQYGVAFDRAERDNLAVMLAARTTLLGTRPDRRAVAAIAGPDTVALVRRIIDDLAATYLVTLDDEELVSLLTLHVGNLVRRAQDGTYTANPLAPAVRDSHPLVHELAVFLAHRVEDATGVRVHPDEIGFLAFHLGAIVERQRAPAAPTRLVLVTPRYHDLPVNQAERLRITLGGTAEVVATVSDLDQDWTGVDADLVVTPVELAGLNPARQVLVGPLLDERDLRAVEHAVREHRRRAGLATVVGQLSRLLDRDLFWCAAEPSTREDVLARMVQGMQDAGVVGPGFLDEVLEREALGPTAFRESVAVPHALRMTANRTAISVLTAPRGVDWAGTPVQLVVLVAFSHRDRRVFRDLFDQLIITLTEPENVARLVARGRGYSEFMAELTRLLDE